MIFGAVSSAHVSMEVIFAYVLNHLRERLEQLVNHIVVSNSLKSYFDLLNITWCQKNHTSKACSTKKVTAVTATCRSYHNHVQRIRCDEFLTSLRCIQCHQADMTTKISWQIHPIMTKYLTCATSVGKGNYVTSIYMLWYQTTGRVREHHNTHGIREMDLRSTMMVKKWRFVRLGYVSVSQRLEQIRMIRPVLIKQEFSAHIYFAGTKARKVGSVKL